MGDYYCRSNAASHSGGADEPSGEKKISAKWQEERAKSASAGRFGQDLPAGVLASGHALRRAIMEWDGPDGAVAPPCPDAYAMPRKSRLPISTPLWRSRPCAIAAWK